MDSSEAVVETLLRNMGFQNIVYEPDGNVPPDFIADGRVAVEVRRLNQNYDTGNGKRGLEETSIPLWQKIEKLGYSFGSATSESWFLSIHFSRPVKPWKKLEPIIRNVLETFMGQLIRTNGRIYADENFELDVIRASQPLANYFHMGGISDQQSGGFIVHEMIKNIAHCLEEKHRKVANFRDKYSEWWLVLTDHIGLGLDDHDKQQFLAHAKRPAEWDKIVVVSPRDPTKWFEY